MASVSRPVEIYHLTDFPKEPEKPKTETKKDEKKFPKKPSKKKPQLQKIKKKEVKKIKKTNQKKLLPWM